jgi:mono/diheme cytochrome c family protein
MSDLLAAAARALGAPEAVVRRSAEARAKATGATIEAVLGAWAGGGEAPAAPPAPAGVAAPTPESPVSDPPAAPPVTAPEASTSAPAPGPAPVAPLPARPPVGPPPSPPVLTGRRESPWLVLTGAVGLLVVALLVGFVAPALPAEGNGVSTSAIPFTQAAREGRGVYLAAGCAACHTQMVRPLVADAGLGGVTLADSNQVLGVRRYGPDLAHVGSRRESADLRAVLEGVGGHPSYAGLPEADLERLIAYLNESA